LNQEERKQTIPLINRMKKSLKPMQLKTILQITANSFSFPIKGKTMGEKKEFTTAKLFQFTIVLDREKLEWITSK
jgi:hypothetical protein